MAKRGEVLIAVLPELLDYSILRSKLWYRIPVDSVDRFLRKRWPPQWLAFYQNRKFGDEDNSVSYYGGVVDIREVARLELFPDDPRDERSERRYYQIFIDELRQLPEPIRAGRRRRITFISTTGGS